MNILKRIKEYLEERNVPAYMDDLTRMQEDIIVLARDARAIITHVCLLPWAPDSEKAKLGAALRKEYENVITYITFIQERYSANAQMMNNMPKCMTGDLKLTGLAYDILACCDQLQRFMVKSPEKFYDQQTVEDTVVRLHNIRSTLVNLLTKTTL